MHMKRLYLFIAFMSIAILNMAAQNLKGVITLVHNGNESYFAYNKITEVINAAENGDTITFSQGNFPGDFILNKAVTLIGIGTDEKERSGNCTILEGNVNINIPNSSKKTNLLFDGILFNQKVTFTSTFGDITLRRCLWSTYFDFENCSIETLLLDRCDCHFYLGASWPTINQNLIAKNCNIYNLCTQGSKNYFYNCTIDACIWSRSNKNDHEEYYCPMGGYFENCIIHNKYAYLNYPYNDKDKKIISVIKNTLYDDYTPNIDVTKNCTLESCYTNSSEDTRITNLTKEELEDNKYLGNDGTVVGYYGGSTTYSFKNPDLPDFPISKKVHFNKEQEQIEVNININSK